MQLTTEQATAADERLASLLRVEALAPVFKDMSLVAVEAIDETRQTPRSVDEVLVVDRLLQNAADYRGSLQRWFSAVPIGGLLAVIVPHAFLHGRALTLPSRWDPRQQRLYTPALLLQEVEDALSPNTYRVRWAGDLDHGYDYGLPRQARPIGDCDTAIVVERISPPAWDVEDGGSRPIIASAPDFGFVPSRTRIESYQAAVPRRIAVLKLDHLGDFILAIPALNRLRACFPDASIDLVVGAWNRRLAEDIRIADRVIVFDAFPRNSSEEEPNVEGTLSQFRALITAQYDLAIDLRVDLDTRILLRATNARRKAAIGTKSSFPFLDIALPLDSTRNDAERMADDPLPHTLFTIQGSGVRRHFALRSDAAKVERDCAIIWGPFLKLEPGDYIFDFHLDLDENHSGVLKLDVALDQGLVVAEMFVSRPTNFHLPFRVDRAASEFEARIWTVPDTPSISFDFYGGRLIRRAPENVLHQSEYALLLVELVRARLLETGMAFTVET